jgi:translation initiation factor 2-alpha kinase 4
MCYLILRVFQPVLTLGLISTGSVRHYSGAIFQVVRNVRKKARQMTEVLAAGGRYDTLLTQFRKPGSMLSQCVVGISIALERVVAAAVDHKGSAVSLLQ